MYKKALVNKMKEYMTFKEKEVEEKSIGIKNMTFVNLRDCLIGLGTILDEDFDLKSYVVSIPSGFADMNNAIVAIQLQEKELYMLGYAPEGIIKQHTVKKAMDKIEKRISEYIKQNEQESAELYLKQMYRLSGALVYKRVAAN